MATAHYVRMGAPKLDLGP